MSWDIFVQDLPPSAKSIAEIPDDFRPQGLGNRSDIIARILDVVPTADFTNPAWGNIDTPDFSIEISLGDSKYVQSFAFHVRGGDQAAVLVAAILRHLGYRALDGNTPTGFFSIESGSAESLQAWQKYRDKMTHPSA